MAEMKLPDEFLDAVNGGVLPEGWEKMADEMAPALRQQYPDVTYEQACEMLAQYIDDPADREAIKAYMRKYF